MSTCFGPCSQAPGRHRGQESNGFTSLLSKGCIEIKTEDNMGTASAQHIIIWLSKYFKNKLGKYRHCH